MKMKLARILLVPVAVLAATTATVVAAPAAHAAHGSATVAEASGWQGQQGGQSEWQGNDGVLEELLEAVIGGQCECGLLGLLLGCG